jgi:hypothetical protein
MEPFQGLEMSKKAPQSSRYRPLKSRAARRARQEPQPLNPPAAAERLPEVRRVRWPRRQPARLMKPACELRGRPVRDAEFVEWFVAPSSAGRIHNQRMQPTTRKDALLTTAHAARRLGVSEGSVRRYARLGELRHVELSNHQRVFRSADIDRFAARRARS